MASTIDLQTEQMVGRIEREGWCVIPQVIPADQVGAIHDSVLKTARDRPNERSGAGLLATSSLIALDQSFASYLADPRIMGPAQALLGKDLRISYTTAIINLPGNPRGTWHADWPFNQNNAAHIPQPYPDAVMHLTSLWMISDFTPETGGTFIVPGSHRARNNPTGGNGVDPLAPHPSQLQASGTAGSVLLLDSRMWHATAPNTTDQPRVAIAVRYAPWWLNLNVLMPGTDERKHMVDERGLKENAVPALSPQVFSELPADVKPLFRHWVSQQAN